MTFVLTLLLCSGIGYLIWRGYQNRKAPKVFPPEWRIILTEEVDFYNGLSDEDKLVFEFRMQQFLDDVNISGVSTEIDDLDQVLVAASAIIPIFGFPNWRYADIKEILIYPSSFNQRFETSGEGRHIRGMVGSGGFMDGRMMLSQRALHNGFSNNSDRRNTAIHEFVHLIDKQDGSIDALPDAIAKHPYSIPWLDLMARKTAEIRSGDSDIDPYAATEHVEFFAVVSEYFFERPRLMQKRHPDLYAQLEHFFKQDMDAMSLNKDRAEIGRNDDCPCGSGKKYKHCHLRPEST